MVVKTIMCVSPSWFLQDPPQVPTVSHGYSPASASGSITEVFHGYISVHSAYLALDCPSDRVTHYVLSPVPARVEQIFYFCCSRFSYPFP
jgi:hypothetical protein